jgi:hypothetical protein
MCRFRTDRSRKAAVLFVLSLTLGGCRERGARVSLDDDARRYVQLAVAVGEHDPDSLDFYAGPADLVASERRNLPPMLAIKQQVAALSARLSAWTAGDAAEAARVRALAGAVGELKARVDLLTGTRLSFDNESRLFFGVAPAPLDAGHLADLRSRVARIVGPGAGRLVERYAAFAARFTIPPDRLHSVMAASLDECRRRTASHLTLPAGERVTLELVTNKPWSAYSRYMGGGHSVIQVNAEFRFTVDQALQVACHEAYPGHHTRNVLVESRRPADERWPEHWVQLTFSRASLLSEAAALAATDVAFTTVERVRIERDRLCPLAGIAPDGVDAEIELERLVDALQILQADVARRYIDGELEFTRAVAALEDEALVPHAEAAVKYMNEYRSYVTAYTTGRAAFGARLAACTGGDTSDALRWRCFEEQMLSIPPR